MVLGSFTQPQAGGTLIDCIRQRQRASRSSSPSHDISDATRDYEITLADFKGKYDRMLTEFATIDGKLRSRVGLVSSTIP